MSEFFFTFGAGQYHGLLANYYVIIAAPTEARARMCMAEAFGGKWSNCYTVDSFRPQIEAYGLHMLGKLDQFGNILERGIR